MNFGILSVFIFMLFVLYGTVVNARDATLVCSDKQEKREVVVKGKSEYICCFRVVCTEKSNSYPVFCTVHNTSNGCRECPSKTCRVVGDLESNWFTYSNVDWFCRKPETYCDLRSGTVMLDYAESSSCPICKCKRNEGYIKFDKSSGECELAKQNVKGCTGEHNLYLWLSEDGKCIPCGPGLLRDTKTGECTDLRSTTPIAADRSIIPTDTTDPVGKGADTTDPVGKAGVVFGSIGVYSITMGLTVLYTCVWIF